MKYKVVVEYEYPVEHKTPVKAELILHGDRVETWNVKPLEEEPTTKNDLGVSSELEKNSKKLEKNFGELDCISRKAVINQIFYSTDNNGDVVLGLALRERIARLPSVTPQEPKTGHWVHGEYCSECGCDVPAYIVDWKWQKDMDAKYCPNCGARMVEPQESEDKE